MSADELKYVQEIPDHCDRIVWRKNYYHLPLENAAATIQRLEAERDSAFHSGAKAVFDNLLFRAANNWHANANINDKCDRENELIRDWAQDALEEVSPDSLMQWKSLTETGRKLDEALQELTPLRALFPTGPLHEQVAAAFKGHSSLAEMVSTHVSVWRSALLRANEADTHSDDYYQHELNALADIDAACKAALQAGAKGDQS